MIATLDNWGNLLLLIVFGLPAVALLCWILSKTGW